VSTAAGNRHHVDPAIARSWLLVPANRPERFTPAADGAADVVVLDVEDAVAEAGKVLARTNVLAWLRAGGQAWVRVNGASTAHWATDLDALADAPGLLGVVLAKTESAAEVDDTAARLRAGTPVVALVESALGVEVALEVARASATLRLAFGVGDYCRDTGASKDPLALAYPRSRLVVASRAAGLGGPVDGPTLAVDEAALVRETELAASLGMTGRLSLRAEQAPTLNRLLSPGAPDVAAARAVVAELGEDGSGVRDGSDGPRLAGARKVLALAAALAGDPAP
jgi:citrate lyase subunit beta/citryl-CoA lyase